MKVLGRKAASIGPQSAVSTKVWHQKKIGIVVMFVSIFVLLAVWTIALYGTFNERNNVINRETEVLDRFAEVVMAQVEQVLDEISVFLKLSNAWFLEQDDIDPRSDTSYLRAIDILRSHNHSYVDIRFVSTDNKLYYRGDKPDKERSYVGDREYIQVHRQVEKKELYLGLPVKSRVTNIWGIPVSMPLTKKQSDIDIIFAAIELPLFLESWQKSIPQAGGSINLFRQDGIVMATSPFREDLQAKSVLATELWAQHITKEAEGVARIAQPFTGPRPRFVAWRSSQRYPIVVTVSSLEEQTLSSWTFSSSIVLGLVLLLSIVVIALDLRIRRMLIVQTEQALALESLARTDALTGMANRRTVLERAELDLARMLRKAGDFACLMIDIDHFKRVNDNLGHAKGDEVLIEFANVLSSAVRSHDIAGRFGGEEFIVFVADAPVDVAIKTAERIRINCHCISTSLGTVTVSIGVAMLNKDDTSLGELIARADKALYQAKETGRDRVCR